MKAIAVLLSAALVSIASADSCAVYTTCTSCLAADDCNWFSGPDYPTGFCRDEGYSFPTLGRVSYAAQCACYNITTNAQSVPSRCANNLRCKWCYDELEMNAGDDNYPHCQPNTVPCLAEL